MKTKKAYLKIFTVLALILTLTTVSCQKDEAIFDRLIGRTWVGDLGFTGFYGPLESGITFSANGFAVDRQYYFDNRFNGPNPAYIANIRWNISGRTLFLDYGNDVPMIEIRYVYVGNGYLDGTLFVNGRDEGPVSLIMQ